MIALYCFQNGAIILHTTVPEAPLAGLVWIDLLEPNANEKAFVETTIGIQIPTPEEMREIEPSRRFYRKGSALFMTANILNKTETPDPETRPITFVLINGTMVTIRYSSPTPFGTFQTRLQTQPELCASAEVALVDLLDAIADRIADTLESVDANVNALSKSIFSPVEEEIKRDKTYKHELKAIGLSAIRCSKVDESLVGLSRLLTFLDANLRQNGQKQVRPLIKALQRDIVSLMGYVERLSEKLQLLLEATLGLVNIQQNAIIKIFSVAAVVFLPPTLIASIYGMNFEFMPELSWLLGYPFALILMLVSAVLPYWYFKQKGWL